MSSIAPVSIGGRPVGPGHPTFVIAELSANHGGSIDRATEVIVSAADAGADAVKLQTYTPDTMTLDLDRPPFIVGEGTLWTGRSLYDLYAEAQTPWDWHEGLFEAARDHGLACFSTPFDPSAIEFLERFDPPAYKIASFELLDTDLIGRAAATGRPLIISTGMGTEREIDEAVSTAQRHGSGGVILLRCNSAYPADPSEMDLTTIPAMVERWGVPVGLSDHTLSSTAAIAAVSLGACMLEKHVTLSRSEPGPDQAFSLEPGELASLIGSVRETEAALGRVRFGPSPAEEPSLAFRRSLWFLRNLDAGTKIDESDVGALRPAGGLPPGQRTTVIGRRTTRSIRRGDPVTEADFES